MKAIYHQINQPTLEKCAANSSSDASGGMPSTYTHGLLLFFDFFLGGGVFSVCTPLVDSRFPSFPFTTLSVTTDL